MLLEKRKSFNKNNYMFIFNFLFPILKGISVLSFSANAITVKVGQTKSYQKKDCFFYDLKNPELAHLTLKKEGSILIQGLKEGKGLLQVHCQKNKTHRVPLIVKIAKKRHKGRTIQVKTKKNSLIMKGWKDNSSF